MQRAMAWRLQDAKNQFSKLVQSARTEGPQTVAVRGERAAVVLSAQEHDALRANRPTLADRLLSGPAWDEEVAEAVLQRDPPCRDAVC
jgi:prevent-host-death family protein